MGLTCEEEAVVRRLEQLELANKAREAEEFLGRVEEVHETVKGLIDGTVDAAELEKQQQREVLRKRAKEIRREEAAARVREELRMGREGKGEGKRPYTYFCRFCLVEYELENLRCCNRCGRELQTREQRVAELQERVQELKGEKQQHASRKARWRRWLQTRKILKSSRLVVDYAAWERWEPSTDEEDKQNEPPVTPADDPNFQALEQDLQRSARTRAGKRAAALRCKERGNALFKAGDWPAALEAYEEGLEHSRDVKELWTNKCLVLLKMQQYQEAHEAATRLLEYCEIFEDGCGQSVDACFKAYSRRALANRALRRYEEALSDLQNAADLQPDDKQVQELLRQTQRQVEQLQRLRQLQQCSGGESQRKDNKEKRANGPRGRKGTLCVQGVSQAGDEEGVACPQSSKEADQGQSTEQLAAGCDGVQKGAAAEGSREAGAASAGAAGEDSASSVAANGDGQAQTYVSAAKKGATVPPELEGGDGDTTDRQAQACETPRRNSEASFHVVGSNQPTSAATPASPPPSPHEKVEGKGEGESLPGATSRLSSSRTSSAGVAAADAVTNGAVFAAGSSSESCSLLQNPALSISSAAAGASSATAATSQHSTWETKIGQGGNFSSCASVSPSTAFPLKGVDTAAQALNELQRLLCPAAAAGSFASIDPPSLSAALELLRFSPVKLSFCCSALPQVTVDFSPHTSTSGDNNNGSNAKCDGLTVQHVETPSPAGEGQNKSECEEQQKRERAGRQQAKDAPHIHRTFLDICVADLRKGALRVRRQRREKTEAAATREEASSQGPHVAGAQLAPPAPTAEAVSIGSWPSQSAMDLYPYECFPALQLVHSVCFVEERNEEEGKCEGRSLSKEKRNSSTDMADTSIADSRKSTRDDSVSCNKYSGIKNCAPSDATPPWLLEVCESAAPYLITLTSELLQLFTVNSRSQVSTNDTATTAKAECSSPRSWGCYNYYKVVSHFEYHRQRSSCGTSHEGIPSVNRRTQSADASHCCAWGACSAALSTSLSLLQQLSVAPLTRRKVAELLQRNSDGRAVLSGILPLLECCTCDSSALAEAAAGPDAGRWPSWMQAELSDAAEGVSGFPSTSLPPRSPAAQGSDQEKSSRDWAAITLAERRLQQARRDAGAVLCNMLLEQPVLRLLLPPPQPAGIRPAEDGRPRPVRNTALQQQQHHCSQQHQNAVQQLEGDGEGGGVNVCTMLHSLLRTRLWTLLRREQLLQQADGAAAALTSRLESGVRPLDILSPLWKQAAILRQQQQHKQRGNCSEAGGLNHKTTCPLGWSALHKMDMKSTRASCGLAAGQDSLSEHDLNGPPAASGAEAIIDTLLRSAQELERLQSYANSRATTVDGGAEDPLREEAQQAVDIITNLGRSSAGRMFVLKHLQQEVLLLLAITSTAITNGEFSERNTDRLSRALSFAESAQGRSARRHQQEGGAVELLCELLAPPRGTKSRSATFSQAVDVLGLLLNLTAASNISAESSRSPAPVQGGHQQPSSGAAAADLSFLQQQLLLSWDTRVGVLPLLLPFLDRVSGEHHERTCGRLAAGLSSPTLLASPAYVASLRSLTLASRVVAAVGAAAQQSSATTSGAGEDPQTQKLELQNEALGMSGSTSSQPCCTIRTPAQKHDVPAGPAAQQTGKKQSMTENNHRKVIVCLLPRVLKLLDLPTTLQKGEEDDDNKRPQQQQQQLVLQEQAGREQGRARWGELRNAALLVLCSLANLNVTLLLEVAARTPPPSLLSSVCASSASAAPVASPKTGSRTRSTIQQPQERTQPPHTAQRCADGPEQRGECPNTGVHRSVAGDSALQRMGSIICSWLQILKPRDYAHQRTEMRDPVAMARGNLLLLVGHLARAQWAALQKQHANEQQAQKSTKHQRGASPQKIRHEVEEEESTSDRQTLSGAAAGGTKGEEAVATASAQPSEAVAQDTRPVVEACAVDVFQRQLADLDLRRCIHCCVESLRKDVEGPQKNAAIALAALARMPKYRSHVDALNGFESLMQIAAPQMLGRR